MRKLVTIAGLQAYAMALAAVSWVGGVRTDEAKYLLNIPYPHPPLARWLLSLTHGMPFHDLFWRIVFASLVVHAVWIVVRLPHRAGLGAKLLLGASWLLSGAVVLQAGTVMMAPLTALFGLLLLWAAARPRSAAICFAAAIAWLISLFIAYQGVLFFPVVVAVCLRSRQPLGRTLLYTCGPLVALALYTASNPLAASLLLQVGAERADVVTAARQTLYVWLLAGSGVLSVLGSLSAFRRSRPELAITLLLLLAYIFRSYHDYYAIFLVPVFVAGLACTFDAFHVRLRAVDRVAIALGTTAAIGGLVAVATYASTAQQTNIARDTFAILAPYIRHTQSQDLAMLIVGDFGHEWQYYAPEQITELRKYSKDMTVQEADIVVCWSTCPSTLLEFKEPLSNAPVPTYVRRNEALHI